MQITKKKYVISQENTSKSNTHADTDMTYASKQTKI